jgi:hypothetical protein
MSEIPARHRVTLRSVLDDLVRGARPDLLTWDREYGESGAELVVQAGDAWTHAWTDYADRADGTAYGFWPLWPSPESPSDPSAEFEVAADGTVRVTDVHVL